MVSARMGAGHDGAARELARRLGLRGVEATVVDIFDCMPNGVGRFWIWLYLVQLRIAPESYDRTYAGYYKQGGSWPRILRAFIRMSRRRVLASIAEHRPDAVVSTYALATNNIGALREEGAVTVPLVNVVTDFGVHPRVVHRGSDLNIAVHPRVAAEISALSPAPTCAPGPLVRPEIAHRLPSMANARAALGLGDEERVVLVLAGSWGVGQVGETVAALLATGRHRVVVACGRHEELRQRMDAAGAVAFGWTDRMPELLAAADVVIENAGGLSAFEAFAARRPVVTHRVIPGHGRENARAMAAAGVTTVTGTDADMIAAVDALAVSGARRDAQVSAAHACFAGDAADDVIASVTLASAQAA